MGLLRSLRLGGEKMKVFNLNEYTVEPSAAVQERCIQIAKMLGSLIKARSKQH